MKKIKFFLFFFFSFFLSFVVIAQNSSKLKFIENQGQYKCKEKYKLNLGGANVYFGAHHITYNFIDIKSIENIENLSKENYHIKGHCIKVSFLNAKNNNLILPQSPTSDKFNFYLGKNKSNWKTDVAAYRELYYKNLYKAIDLKYYEGSNGLKYDFILNPGSNYKDISMNYEGQEQIFVKNGNLIIKTSVNNFVEEKPYAYQSESNGRKKKIECTYVLKNNKVTFSFPKGYDCSKIIIIDPGVIFSSYSPSSTFMSPDAATYDSIGNFYTSAGTFSTGYVATPGAFSTTYSGNWDMIIEKYASNGNTLLYSAIFGGADEEYPYSLFCDQYNNLFVLGTTSSSDFPVVAGCYDVSLNGLNASLVQDYCIVKINSSGNALLASTYLGGNDNDGGRFQQNVSSISTDKNGNVYVCGISSSSDYPTTIGVFQNAIQGASDGVITKFNNDLTRVLLSTFLGGAADDNICDVKIANNGNICVVGVTSSSDFPATMSSINPSYLGNQDGFVSIINPSATAIFKSTYLGTADYDMAKFIQVDPLNDIYVIGSTINSSYPVTQGAYNWPGQNNYFVHKLSSDLNTTRFSCCVGGNANATRPFVPTSFGIDKCNNIYFSVSNSSGGFPVTPDAIYQQSKSIYLCSIDLTGTTLRYGSYFGGNPDQAHIHISTNNRINDEGILFHSECTTASDYDLINAISPKNTFSNIDASFKFDIGYVKSSFQTQFSFTNPTCGPEGNIQINTIGGSGNFEYTWSPNVSNTSIALNLPVGAYSVLVQDLNSVCNIDTQRIKVILTESHNQIKLSCDTFIWNGTVYNVSGQYTHFNTICGLNDTLNLTIVKSTINDEVVFACDSVVWHNRNYYVSTNTPQWIGVNSVGCDSVVTLHLTVGHSNTGDTSAFACDRFTWYGTTYVSTSSPTKVFTNVSGCDSMVSLHLTINQKPSLGSDKKIDSCLGANLNLLQLYNISNLNAHWLYNHNLISNPQSVSNQGKYELIVTDLNGCSDTALVDYYTHEAFANAGLDGYTLLDEPYQLSGIGGITCEWDNAALMNNSHIYNPIIKINNDTKFEITTYDNYGCKSSDFVIIKVLDGDFYIPNSFTPNGDGINDIFRPILIHFQELNYFKIYNRFGQLVFETNQIGVGWDGIYKGVKQDIGNYVWMIEAKAKKGSKRNLKGNCLLLR